MAKRYIMPGQSLQFTGTLRDIHGLVRDVTNVAVWTSSDTNVATIESFGDPKPGLAHAVGTGSLLETVGRWQNLENPSKAETFAAADEYTLNYDVGMAAFPYWFEFQNTMDPNSQIVGITFIPLPDSDPGNIVSPSRMQEHPLTIQEDWSSYPASIISVAMADDPIYTIDTFDTLGAFTLRFHNAAGEQYTMHSRFYLYGRNRPGQS